MVERRAHGRDGIVGDPVPDERHVQLLLREVDLEQRVQPEDGAPQADLGARAGSDRVELVPERGKLPDASPHLLVLPAHRGHRVLVLEQALELRIDRTFGGLEVGQERALQEGREGIDRGGQLLARHDPDGIADGGHPVDVGQQVRVVLMDDRGKRGGHDGSSVRRVQR
jgi:hypothetical protein